LCRRPGWAVQGPIGVRVQDVRCAELDRLGRRLGQWCGWVRFWRMSRDCSRRLPVLRHVCGRTVGGRCGRVGTTGGRRQRFAAAAEFSAVRTRGHSRRERLRRRSSARAPVAAGRTCRSPNAPARTLRPAPHGSVSNFPIPAKCCGPRCMSMPRSRPARQTR